MMLRYSENGSHFCFEPLPYLYKKLVNKNYNATIHNYALSDKNGKSTFQFVKNAPAYSGLKRRSYDVKNPIIEEIDIDNLGFLPNPRKEKILEKEKLVEDTKKGIEMKNALEQLAQGTFASQISSKKC